MKNNKLLIVLLSALLAVSGCNAYKNQQCVFVASPHLAEPPIKATYWKDDNGSHWFYVDGVVHSEQHHDVVLTSCEGDNS